MGKDKNGTYLPPKGRPSGSPKETHGLKDAFAVNDLETDKELAEKYTDGPDQPSANVPMRHKNRNVNKGEDNDE
ncbi:hypothetical protein [Pedobacter sp. SYSU D00535]|uniref:hypothetical protein n=1 Tax=Pedobacter sp. SYSU D00535 TaxID=2810308 RepID=UPI001A9625BF|nr:hypothetical protein [Pedobacter sp. SYSU D00535]